MRHLVLGLSLILALAACTEAAQEDGAPQTAAPVTTTSTPPHTTAATGTPTAFTTPQGSPSPGAMSPSPTVSPTSTASPSTTAAAAPPVGEQAQVTRVVDGDTIDVLIAGATYRVRYIGIDTPETVDPGSPVQCYGREASERNRGLVEGRTVSLEKDVSETDRYGRLLRYVWVDGEMVNATLVREGYAMASTYPPDVKYQELFLDLQQQAREAGLGLWGPVCVPTPVASGVCDFSGTEQPIVKGNISQTTGEKIYHVPGGEFYDATVIDESAGERWFCTEQEAVAAGWRRSKR